MKKRLLSLFLSVVMVLALLPVKTYAADGHTHNYEKGICECGAHNGEHDGWTEWTQTASLPAESGYFYLAADVALTSTWQVPTGTIYLCLNGHLISSASGADSISLVSVPDGATLNLYDCSTKKHFYKVGSDGLWTLDTGATEGTPFENLTARPDAGTVIEVVGGCITGGKSKTNNVAGGVSVSTGGVFTMNGGNLVGNSTAYRGGAVNVLNGAFNLKSGNILGNLAMGDGEYTGGGAGVCVNGGTLTMAGGNISFNTVPKYAAGGIMVLYISGGSFIMSDGNIKYNYANGNGGGVCTNRPFTMTGGCIEGNVSSVGGGGVRVTANGSMTATGGQIINNSSTSDGGGVNMAGTVTLGGTIKINGNKKGTGSSAVTQNIFLPSGKTVTVATGDDAPTDDMSVGITTATAPTATAPVAFTGENSTDYHKNFFPDAGRLLQDVSYVSKKLCLSIPKISVSQTGTNPVYGTAMPSNEFYSVSTNGFGDAPDLKLEWKSGTGTSNVWGDDAPEGITAGLTNGKIFIATDATLNAGTYTFRVTNGENEFTTETTKNPMFVTSAETVFTVGKASLTVTAKDKSITYGDAAANNGVEYSGFKNSDTETNLTGTLTYEYKDSSSTVYTATSPAGSYDIIPSGLTSGNYEITFEKGTLTVNKKELAKPEAVTKSYTYNGTEQNFELTGFDSSTMEIAGNAQTNANEAGYTVSVTLKDADNYAWSTEGSCTFIWVIAKAIVNDPSIESKVYTGTTLKADVPTSPLYTVTVNEGGVPAGNYNVELTLTDSANYKWSDSETAAKTLKFEITARPKYAVNGYSDGFGNTVTANPQNAEKDTKVALMVIPAAEYTLTMLDVKNASGASITLATDNTFIMPECEVTVNAVFAQNTYGIAGYSDAIGNAVTADLANAPKGAKVTLTVSAAAKYKLKSLTAKDAAGNTVAVEADNSFIMPGMAVTVTAVFEKEKEPIIIIIPPAQPAEDSGNDDASGTEGTTGTEDKEGTEGGKNTGTEGAGNDENAGAEGGKNADAESGKNTGTEGTEGDKNSDTDAIDAEEIGVNPITEKKNALVIDELISAETAGNSDGENLGEAGDGDTTGKAVTEAEKAAATKAIVEAIETAISESGTKDFILKADEQTVTEQGIENKAYADAATETITEVTKPSETKSVTLESAIIETLAKAEEVESLTVMTSVADVELDAKTIESISEQSSGSVQLVVTLIKEEIAQSANEDNKVYFDVSLIKEDGTKITTFDGGNIKVTLPIPKASQNEPVVVVYTDNKGHYSPVNGHVNADGTYTFITEHLSEYILMTRREAEEMYNSIYDFGTLLAHVENRTENTITLDWNQYEDADGYIIYGNYCNHDGETYKIKKLATITDSSQTEYTVKKLESGTNYKFRIKAYKVVNGEKYVTVKSHYVHAATLGGKQRVTSDIQIAQTGMKKTNIVTLKEGQTYTVDAERLTDSGKTVHHVTMHYESSDASVATVTLRSGKITAVGKGACTVLAIAENGLYEEITVKVK